MSLCTNCFKNRYGEQERRAFSTRALESYPGYIPVIVERYTEKDPPCDKTKYMVPQETPWYKFSCEVNKHVYSGKASGHSTIYLMVNGTLPPQSSIVGQIYEANKDVGDGFLYVVYCQEDAFGTDAE